MHNSLFKLLFCALGCFVFSCQNHNNDYFHGQITYKYHYTSNTLNADSLNSHRIHSSVFKYDQNDYQSTFIDKDSTTYYYVSAINKCLMAINSQLQNTCEDYSKATDSILDFKVYDTNEKILGQNCRILEFQGLYFWNRFYVSKDIQISPNIYKNHKAYNWQFYGNQAAGGLILKLEHRFKNFTMHGEAVSISEMDLNQKALDISAEAVLSICN